MPENFPFRIFISYRRDGGETLGRLFFELLKGDYSVFFDHESLSSGRFDTKLLDIIAQCNDVLVILSKGCLERCQNEGDWFMQEISCALAHSKNIILLITEDFEMPTGAELAALPPQLTALLKYNGYRVSVAYIDSIISKLHQNLKTPKTPKASAFDDISEWRAFAACLTEERYRAAIPADVQRAVLQNAVTACLGETNGMILNSMIDSTFSGAYNIRTKYRYEIDINESFGFSVTDIDEGRYYELAETLSYTKKFITGGLEKHFWLSFVTNLDALDEELKSENFFFSENLLINPEDMAKLVALDEDDRLDFYLSDMRVKININGKTLTPVELKINEGGIFARYELAEDGVTDLNVKLRFRIPHKKTNCYFFASINDPTYSPFIRFSYPEDELNVTMIPFLSRSLTAKDTKVFEGLRELSVENEWIMPVSGAIFIINKENA